MASDLWTIVTTDSFADDFDEASLYYAKVSGVQSLSHFVDSYDNLIGNLEAFPKIGPKLEHTDYRWHPTGAFIALYRALEESKTVSLMRLVYLSPNWKMRLESGEKPAKL